MTLFKLFFLIALLNGLALIAALLSRKENRLANLFLSGMIAAGVIGQFVRYLFISREITRFPYLFYSGFPISLLVPSFLYLYILALTVPDFRWRPRLALHFLPFLIGLVTYGGLLLFGPAPDFESASPLYRLIRHLLLAVSVFAFGVYLVAGFVELKHYQTLVQNYFSEIRHVRLWWLRWLLLLLTIPWVISLLEVVSGPYYMVGQWMIPAAAVIILLIGFYGLRQSVIFSSEEKWGKPSSEKDSPSGSSKTQETTSQIFTSEELIQWKDRLEKFTREEKPYLDPRLHLIGLSGKLRLKPYQVSEILNRGMGASFYEYINRFRVEEVKRRLMDPQLAHLSILGIAMDCGFNSKSVFNETFRKYTSMTPSQFRTASS